MVSKRKIKPTKLIYKDKYWYLHSFCTKANEERTFKFSRIISIDLLDETFTYDFHANNSIKEDNLFLKEDLLDIKLKIPLKYSYKIYDEFSNSCIYKKDDFSLYIKIKLAYNEGIFSYILSFGEGVEIIKPSFLNEEMLKYLKKWRNILKTDSLMSCFVW